MTTTADRPLILFVCTGNICRSPLAERLTTHLLGDAAAGFRVESAGTRALVGQPMDPQAAQQLAGLGGTAAGHTARQLTADLLREADLVLTATRRHRSQVVEMFPGVVHHTFTVRQLGRILEGAPERVRPKRARPDPIHDLLHATTQRRGLARPADPGDDDIDDPYGRTRRDQQRSAEQQVPALTTLAAFLRA